MNSIGESEATANLRGWHAEEALIDADGSVHRGWRSVLASVVCLALGPSVVLLMCFGVFVPALHREFGWSIGSISVGAMIISLVMMVLSPVQGYLVDRFGSRRVILTSLPLFGISVGLLYFLPADIRVFYAACVLLPIVSVGAWPLSYMRLVSTWFDRRLGLALGVTMVGTGIGAATLPILLGGVFERSGWRMAYAYLGAAVLLLVWPLALQFIRESSAVSSLNERNPSSQPKIGLSMAEVLRERSFWGLGCAFFLVGILTNGMLVHQVSILIDRGLSQATATQLQALIGIAAIVGRLAAGWLLDRVRVSRLMPVLMLGGAAACLVYAIPAPATLLTISAFALGIVVGAEFDALAFAIRRYHGMRSFGAVYGWIFAIFQLGSAIGAVGLGMVRNTWQSYVPGMFAFAFICAAAALTFACFGPYRFHAAKS